MTHCPSCRGTDFVPLAAGVEQLGDELRRALPDATVAVMQGHDQPVPDAPAVLVLTRGSVMDAPPGPIGAVVLPDLDALARRPGFDAGEDALRLAMQLGRWAAPTDAEVVVRTEQPGDAVIQALVRWDPGGYWRDVEEERTALVLPPASSLVAIDVVGDQAPMEGLLAAVPVGERLGPVATDRGRRVLVRTQDVAATLDSVADVRRAASKAGQEVRVDVEPVGV